MGKPNTKKTPSKGGRPSLFKPEYCIQAKKLCLLGATDKELADFFNTTEQTLNSWKKIPEFLESLKAGKESADANVANRLYKRAIGFKHAAVKIFCDTKTGAVTKAKYTEIYPPDTTACIFWLKNRQPAKWRDKVEQVHSGNLQLDVSTTQFQIKQKGK